jgi:hypothetical protein
VGKMMKNANIGQALIQTIKESGIRDVSLDLAEMTIDSFLDQGIIREIPILKTVVSFFKSGICLRDALFLHKVTKFLLCLNNVSEENKQKFFQNLDENPNEIKKLGNTLVMIIERLDDLDKPEFLAKIFIAYINEKINFSEFRRLARAIDKACLDDINRLLEWSKTHIKFYEDGRYSITGSQFFPELLDSGLISIESTVDITVDEHGDGAAELEFEISGFGIKLLEILQKKNMNN